MLAATLVNGAENALHAGGVAGDATAFPGEILEGLAAECGKLFVAKGEAAEGLGRLLGHGVSSAGAEDDAFKQGIAGEAVGAVDAGAGGFAGGIEAGDGSASLKISADAAHEVMRGGMDGSGLPGQIDAEAQAGFVDAGEALADPGGGFVSEVEQHVGGGGRLHFGDDGAADDIAGGELLHVVIAVHETFAVDVAQQGAFAAKGLAEKETRAAGDEESGGMKLNELDVGHFGADAVGHADAIPGGDAGVGGIAIELTGAAGGEQDGAGMDVDALLSLLVIGHRAGHGAVGEKEVGDGGKADEAKPGQGGSLAPEGAGDFMTGGIAAGVQDAADAVRALAGAQVLAVFLVEIRAPVNELFDAARAFLHEGRDGGLKAEAIARHERVQLV